MGKRKPPATDPWPEQIQPKLLSLASVPPPGNWLYEMKFDGYRFTAGIRDRVRLFTRNGHDWTNRLPVIAAELGQLELSSAWLDGEVVAQDDEGRPIFHPLQGAFSSGRTDDLVYFVFDVLYLEGRDLRGEPIERRRSLLQLLIERVPLDHVRFSESFEVHPRDLLASVDAMGMEGIVGKRAGSLYTPERDGAWIKLKCSNRQEFVIVGYTRAAGGIGSLLLALHDDIDMLVYAGRVQSGLSGRKLAGLRARLGDLQRDTCPMAKMPTIRKGLSVVWLEPKQLCEIKFAEITPSGKVRHAVFVGLRDDKNAISIQLES
ncbi:non-homologous end-joining DNA ligase [Pseudomonas sp. PDM25]|uniref:non-homologous end-joining DNA ligase n=1 Tax=Pseudomonas sp. PDM25 TaxID=2854772 RepID=UPI001C469622|nr:non-homologous end-joining DNA ligase [Pseudomonas sp. PDM25]MBV7514543.1 non-homologous end-joining DNA ligase [Pseudomonas sp. PDM25]